MGTILIADDHELIRRGIRTVIEGFPEKYNIIEASTCAEVIQQLASHRVQYAIMEMFLADGNLFFSRKNNVLRYTSKTSLFVYSANAEKIYARRLLQKGVRCFLNKKTGFEELTHAIRTFLNDEIYLTASLKEMLAKPSFAGIAENPLEALSDREIEIVENIVTGISTSELAQRLELDISTISTYRRRAFKKLEVSNIIELREKLMAYRT